ncbi:MAG: cyanophycin synthetase, partial [Rhodothermales bacterium]|nr:cyanophycin synthetase [Rhodothermales bacterium]
LGGADRAELVAHPAGPLVLNADDPSLVARAPAFGGQIGWFSLEAGHPLVQVHLERGGVAAFVEGDAVVVAEGAWKEPLLAVEAMPFALGGAARHNVANALAAACAAQCLGVPAAAIAEGLRTFRNDPIENPGRTNVFTVEGATVVVDFAHNPHGLDALVETVRRMPARRRLVTLGQAGDRSDDDVRGLVRAACRIAPDHAVVMELPGYERGRAPGEVAGLVEDELRRHGLAGDAAVTRVATSLDAVEAALRWAAPGDLLLLLVYGYRDAVFARLAEAGAEVVA